MPSKKEREEIENLLVPPSLPKKKRQFELDILKLYEDISVTVCSYYRNILMATGKIIVKNSHKHKLPIDYSKIVKVKNVRSVRSLLKDIPIVEVGGFAVRGGEVSDKTKYIATVEVMT